MVYGGKLYGTAYSYYDADANQVLSHYRSGLNLSVKGDVQGMYQVGSLEAGFVSGYISATKIKQVSSAVNSMSYLRERRTHHSGRMWYKTPNTHPNLDF